jgi:hypothetical protein
MTEFNNVHSYGQSLFNRALTLLPEICKKSQTSFIRPHLETGKRVIFWGCSRAPESKYLKKIIKNGLCKDSIVIQRWSVRF